MSAFSRQIAAFCSPRFFSRVASRLFLVTLSVLAGTAEVHGYKA